MDRKKEGGQKVGKWRRVTERDGGGWMDRKKEGRRTKSGEVAENDREREGWGGWMDRKKEEGTI